VSTLRRHWPTFLGLGALVVLCSIEAAAGRHVVPLVLFVLAPLAVAIAGTAEATAVVAGVALVAAIVVALAADSTTSTGRWVLSLLGVAIGCALAVLLARVRHRAEEQAAQLRVLAEVERQLTSALDVLGEAVTITDQQGRTLYVNDAAVDLLRAETADEVLSAEPGELMARFAVYDELGQPVELMQLPGARLRSGEPDVPPMLVRNVVRASGEERWLLNKASLVPGENGAPDRVVNVIEDLTVLKRAELRQRLLAEATRELAASLDYERTLQRVAEVVVPELADWCAVSMPGRAGAIESVAIAHQDPDKVHAARALAAGYPNRLDDDTDLAAILRGEAGTSVQAVPEGAVEAYAVDAEHLRLLSEIGFGSILLVPLDAAGQRLGAMVLVRSDPLRQFSEEDTRVAEEVAARAATAVFNARLYAEHSELAATLQRGMLPPQLPVVAGWTAAALDRPAGEIGEVGGDFYDAFPAGDDWMVVIGDVTGHGPEAATLTALVRYTLRTAGELTGDPVAAIAHLNRSLRAQPQLSLCTVACVRLASGPDGTHVTVASCGHPLPILVRDGEPRPIGRGGPLAGAFDDADAWPAEAVAVQPGDLLVLYTDGVVDALSHRGRRGEESMHALLSAARRPDQLIAALDAALDAEPDERRRDDTAAVVLERLAARVPA
jgi:PAS domain S-box-containing protein